MVYVFAKEQLRPVSQMHTSNVHSHAYKLQQKQQRSVMAKKYFKERTLPYRVKSIYSCLICLFFASVSLSQT